MKYSIQTTSNFRKQFKKLDRYTQKMIKYWIDKNLIGTENPRSHGRGLTSDKSGKWRYRIGDYRIICEIDDNKLIILTLSVGHRSEVYKN